MTLSSMHILVMHSLLYNNYSETHNLIGQYPCRMRQSCTEYLNAFRGVFKMSDNENISMCEINNNSVFNKRQVYQNSEQRFTITTESELTWPLFHCSYFIN